MNVFRDKIYSKLKEEHIRDKILNGTLKREECNNDDVHEFMQLLKKPGGYEKGNNKMEAITEEEWTQVVKKQKERVH